jgi:hypothetical protein
MHLCLRIVSSWLVLAAAATSNAATLSIVELEDVDFGIVPRSAGAITQSFRFCVSIDPRGPFQITGTGDGSGGAFTLLNTGGGGFEIGYEVVIIGQVLIPGVPFTGIRAGPPGPGGECRPPRYRLTVTLDATDLASAMPGHYRGRLQLTVAPE